MIKKGLLYLILFILPAIVVSGCINYTDTSADESVLVQLTGLNKDQSNVSGYADFRFPTLSINSDSLISVSDGALRENDDKECCLILYSAYEVMYNTEYKIPKWVKYELLKSETDGRYSRKGLKFIPDPTVNLPQAEDYDYKGSGWSRGHMAPAADFKWSSRAMIETFYFTNCCPQNQALNSGQWHTLEKKVREWANRYGTLTVYTGPIVLDNVYGTIGYNKVVIPDAFFKAILAGEQTIAFVMYNHNNNESLQKCAMSVDDLEILTGINFFEELDDTLENRVEATYVLKEWSL